MADFIGDTNLLSATVAAPQSDGTYLLDVSVAPHGKGDVADDSPAPEATVVRASARPLGSATYEAGQRVAISVRPEDILYSALDEGSAAPADRPFSGEVVSSQFLGSHYRSVIRLDGGREIHANNSHVDRNLYAGAHVSVGWDAADALIVGEA